MPEKETMRARDRGKEKKTERSRDSAIVTEERQRRETEEGGTGRERTLFVGPPRMFDIDCASKEQR